MEIDKIWDFEQDLIKYCKENDKAKTVLEDIITKKDLNDTKAIEELLTEFKKA